MPDEHEETGVDKDDLPATPLHAHGEGREEDIEGEVGGGTGDDQDADTAEKTGGATSGGPGGAAEGEDDPSNVEHDPDDSDN